MAESNGKGTSRELQGLARRINAGHEQCLAAVRKGLASAVETGDLLLTAQQRVQEAGEEWLPWVEANCKFSKSQAQRYMRVADGYHKLKEASENPEELSLTEALRMLRGASSVASKKSKDERIVVPSERAKREAIEGADHVRLPDGAKAEKFVREQAGAIARRVLKLMKQDPPTNAAGQPIDSATAAVAILRQIQEALDASLVVRADAAVSDEPDAESAPRLHNRLNGKHPVAAK